MLTTSQVVDYILARSVDRPCPMKLQKLLYYVQGYCLALRGEPMFDAEFEAWTHGPVVPEVYHQYKHCGCRPISKPIAIDEDTYEPENVEVLSAVLTAHGQFTAVDLSDLAHEESPWLDARKRGGRGVPITRKALADWFNTLMDDDEGAPIRRDQFHHQKRRLIAKRMGRHRDKLAALAERNKDLDPWADEG